MKVYIVALATIVAVFWDEALLSIVSVIINKKIDPMFMLSWVIISGVLASILISYNVPKEYREITILLIGFAVYSVSIIINGEKNNQHK